jgi:hypothetical protein
MIGILRDEDVCQQSWSRQATFDGAGAWTMRSQLVQHTAWGATCRLTWTGPAHTPTSRKHRNIFAFSPSSRTSPPQSRQTLSPGSYRLVFCGRWAGSPRRAGFASKNKKVRILGVGSRLSLSRAGRLSPFSTRDLLAEAPAPRSAPRSSLSGDRTASATARRAAA